MNKMGSLRSWGRAGKPENPIHHLYSTGLVTKHFRLIIFSYIPPSLYSERPTEQTQTLRPEGQVSPEVTGAGRD